MVLYRIPQARKQKADGRMKEGTKKASRIKQNHSLSLLLTEFREGI
jgi:hypothetical protein